MDFEEQVQQQIQQMVGNALQQAGVQVPAGTPPNQQQPQQPAYGQQYQASQANPYTLTIDGQTFTYNSQEELNRAVQGMANMARQSIEQSNTPSEPPPTEVEEPQFDTRRFTELMDANPVEAFQYADQFTETGRTVAELQERLAGQQRLFDAYLFKDAHPEFQASPNAAQIVNGILTQNGWDFNHANLEASLALAQQNGLLPTRQQYEASMRQYEEQQSRPQVNPLDFPPLPQPQQQQPQAPWQQQQQSYPQYGPLPPGPGNQAQFGQSYQQQMPTMSPPPAPPSTGNPSGGEIPTDWAVQAENMTADQIEQYLRTFQGMS